LYNRYAVRPKANYKIVERTAHNIVNNDLVKTVNPIATIIADSAIRFQLQDDGDYRWVGDRSSSRPGRYRTLQ
jgi:hypothetical protein